MGCDWYTFHSVTCVGFIVTKEQYQVYKHMLGEKYGCFIYSEPNGENITTYIFIYDKETIIYNTISVPGPYDIDNSDNSTEIFEQTHMVKFFQNQIDQMRSHFDPHEETCTYWSVLTTLGIGEFELSLFKDDKYAHTFTSIDDYCEYHGYHQDNREDDEEDEDSN